MMAAGPVRLWPLLLLAPALAAAPNPESRAARYLQQQFPGKGCPSLTLEAVNFCMQLHSVHRLKGGASLALYLGRASGDRAGAVHLVHFDRAGQVLFSGDGRLAAAPPEEWHWLQLGPDRWAARSRRKAGTITVELLAFEQGETLRLNPIASGGDGLSGSFQVRRNLEASAGLWPLEIQLSGSHGEKKYARTPFLWSFDAGAGRYQPPADYPLPTVADP